MSIRTLFATAVLSAALSSVRAAPGPLTPDTGIEGKTCTINWSLDTTGDWTNTAIELKTGDNWNMVHLTTVTTLDATKVSSYSWTCPDVTINSAIYFYQFSAAGQDLTWTTRFAIAGADGSTVPPPETTQPDGQLIGWGTGALADPSTAVAAPAWLSSGGGATGSSASASGSTAASTPSSAIGATPSATGGSASASTPVGTPSSAVSSASSSGLTKVNTASSTASKSASSSASSPSAGSVNSSTTGASGAASLHVPMLALSAIVGALVFTV